MKPGVSFLDVVILLGALQGFIISAVLFFNREKTQGDKYFATFLFLLSLACLNIYLLDTGFGSDSVIISVLAAVLPTVVIMPVGPLAYFYIRWLINPAVVWNKKDRIHFYPVIIDLVPSLASIVYIIAALTGLIES